MNKLNLNHLYRMTDVVGMAEHCLIATPDLREGYCVDDNARALQVALRLKEEKLVDIYLKFLVSAAGKYGFKNDMNQSLVWENESIGENFGRAMVALGETTLLAPQDNQKFTAALIFDQQAYLIPTVKYPKVMAQTIIAISKRIKFSEKWKSNSFKGKPLNLKKELIFLSDRLIRDYLKHSSKSWKWYEDIITYDGGRLPLSLFCAFQVTKNQKYLEVAKESLDFIIEQTYDHSKDCFSFVGNKGWYPKGKKPAIFDQQPIEAGSMVEVCVKAYEVLKDLRYLHFAKTAFSWYSGKNILGLPMINSLTGGVYDGLEEKGVNLNQGAESLLSYLLAHLSFKD